jgi:hypothetical protein
MQIQAPFRTWVAMENAPCGLNGPADETVFTVSGFAVLRASGAVFTVAMRKKPLHKSAVVRREGNLV